MSRKVSLAPMLGAVISNIHPERKPTERAQLKEHARETKRRATEDWVAGRITTPEHSALHARAEHVLSGKSPRAFKGKTGERKIRGLM